MTQKKKRGLWPFRPQKDGRGISKAEQNLPPNLKRFWILYRENFFSRFLMLNVMMLLGNFPVVFIVMALLGVGKAAYLQPAGELFSIVDAISGLRGGFSPSDLAMLGVTGTPVALYAATPWTYVLYGLGALTIFTWGFVNVGVIYILRNIVLGRPVFLWSDFWDAIRRNRRQAFCFGLIDVAVLVILPYNVYSLFVSGGNFLSNFFFWTNVIILLFFFILRVYAYLQIVSFQMKIWKMIKNAAYFVLLGFKRNALATLGAVILTALLFIFAIGFGGRLIVISLGIAILTLFSSVTFMYVFAAWPKIDEIMVIHEAAEEE